MPSNNKIIFFIVLICASVMSAVFLYHWVKTPAPILSSNERTLFSIPRDIKPFELGTTENKKFNNKDFLNHWTLLFFGFTHCSNVCPTTLNMLAEAYPLLQSTFPSLQVVLVSLDPERDTPSTLSQYTRRFHADFIGVSGKISALRNLQGQLGIYSERDDSSSSSNYQIQHTSTILLIDPQGKWAGLFKYGMTPPQFVKEFKEGVKSISSSPSAS